MTLEATLSLKEATNSKQSEGVSASCFPSLQPPTSFPSALSPSSPTPASDILVISSKDNRKLSSSTMFSLFALSPSSPTLAAGTYGFSSRYDRTFHLPRYFPATFRFLLQGASSPKTVLFSNFESNDDYVL
ncbi:hypothetical protein VNO80_19043 [Phaseolus coccineus]|uniref:Uncharacterized protein n=1 Tax=Phaseolus coccineus TaxID=3886 RepID=A0AAN9MK59_PHACN